VREVVYAATDPNPVASGAGPAALRAAGVRVRRARAPAALRPLLGPYRAHLGRGRPWVIAKWAMTLDGRIAAPSGDSRWISGTESRAFVHGTLRARVDAILVGAGTVRRDDPSLTNRSGGGGQPLRVLLAGRRGIPEKARLWGLPGGTLVARPRGARVDLERLLRDLYGRGVRRLLVEGGARTLGAFLDAGLVDQVCVFVAPRLLGAGIPAIEGRGAASVRLASRLESLRATASGTDVRLEGLLSRRRPAGGRS
jgi:diaminohydroxyphosphoribosylaminopyrimidine deaminase/5-amino-6-(5-phosphoribosylamino)uracil reductase